MRHGGGAVADVQHWRSNPAGLRSTRARTHKQRIIAAVATAFIAVRTAASLSGPAMADATTAAVAITAVVATAFIAARAAGVAVVRGGYYGGRGYYGGGYRTGYYGGGYRTGHYGHGHGYYGHSHGYGTGYYGRPYGYGYGVRVAATGYYGDYNGDGYPDAGYYGGDYNGDGYPRRRILRRGLYQRRLLRWLWLRRIRLADMAMAVMAMAAATPRTSLTDGPGIAPQAADNEWRTAAGADLGATWDRHRRAILRNFMCKSRRAFRRDFGLSNTRWLLI